MKTNRRPNTYLGQEARIIRAATLSNGTQLFALKTICTVVATEMNGHGCLERIARELRLKLTQISGNV